MFRLYSMILLFVLCAPASWSQVLHALIVADTTPPDLTPGARISMERAENLVLDIGRHTGMQVESRILSGSRLTPEAVWRAVDDIRPGPNDTVFFYYVGHGENSPAGELPNLIVGASESGAVDANSVMSTLERKGQRLLVALIEACNRRRASLTAEDTSMMAGFSSPSERYSAFFQNSSGTFIASAAAEGEWAFLSANFGGHFTQRFMESLVREDSWDLLAAAIKKPIVVQQEQGASRAVEQNPIVRLNVRMRTPTAPIHPPAPRSPNRPRMIQLGGGISVAETPTTVGQFRAFIESTGYHVASGCHAPTFGGSWPRDPLLSWRNPGQWQTDDHPVVCISHIDAESYARWLSRVEGRRYGLMRLRTWEDLAWRVDAWENAVCSDCAITAPSAQEVRSTRSDRYGLYDIIGNVWQWLDECSGQNCELRGGAWLDPISVLRSRRFKKDRFDFRTVALGFRVVRYD